MIIYIVCGLWIFILVCALIPEEIDWITDKIKKLFGRLKMKMGLNSTTVDEHFIRKAAHDELLRKCREAADSKESPYLSIEEIENVVSELKNRRAK